MAWVRYDDKFYSNPKVTAAIHEDPGAIALHVLANTWTNGQKLPGYVPAHQTALLVCDRQLGAQWAGVLVRAGLWHERGSECAECAEEYAHLPGGSAGFVFHNAQEYRAPARDRVTPGTPADLSEKRRAAGRRGGKASAAKRQQNGQTSKANEANGVSKNSNLLPAGVSPEPVPVPATEPPTEVLFGAPPEAPPTQEKATRATRRATRIPDDFTLSQGMQAWARDRMAHVDAALETEKFVNYWSAKSGKDATKTDWAATWRNWMLNAADRYPSNGGYPDRNGIAVRDTQPRQSAGERKFNQAQQLKAELDAEFAGGGRR